MLEDSDNFDFILSDSVTSLDRNEFFWSSIRSGVSRVKHRLGSDRFLLLCKWDISNNNWRRNRYLEVHWRRRLLNWGWRRWLLNWSWRRWWRYWPSCRIASDDESLSINNKMVQVDWSLWWKRLRWERLGLEDRLRCLNRSEPLWRLEMESLKLLDSLWRW